MKKKIPTELKDKITRIFARLEGVDNTVPHDLKSTFNFKGRKSVSVAQTIIQQLANPGDVIYDPFCGGGSFLIAAVQAHCKGVGTELDNYTYHVLKTLFQTCDAELLQAHFDTVAALAKQPVMDLYQTTCCGQKNYISKLLYDPQDREYFHPAPNREIVDGKNVKLAFQCPVCGEQAKAFGPEDLRQIEALEALDSSAFPRDKYIENSRINITASTGADRYDRLFTQRNKLALLTIQAALDTLPPGREKDLLQHALVASLSLARTAMYGSSTDILYHVVPQGAQEMNVWLLFQRKYRHFLTFKRNYPHMQAEDVGAGEKYALYHSDYKAFLDSHPAFRPDMVYTDFPYTDQVPYLERNQLFRVWLARFANREQYRLTDEMLEREIVQTDAPSRREKNIRAYYRDLDTLFRTLGRHLKPGGIAAFTMKLGKAKYFNTYIEIVNLARKNGFEYLARAGLEKNDPTLRKQSAYANTFINEMVVLFYKLPEGEGYWYMENDNYEFEIVKKVYHLLRKSEVTLTGAVQLIINDLRSRYSHIAGEADIQRIVRVIEENFVCDRGSVQISPNRLYLEIEDDASLYIKLYDLIPIHIGNLLKKEGRFVLQDLYFELINSLCDGNPNTIAQILEDPRHQSDITHLIQNYCDLQGQYYVAKTRRSIVGADAVDVSQLNGSEFEQLIRELLAAEGFFNVVVKGGAGDLGVDITASRLAKGNLQHHIFQCKRWAANVGSEPIQRLVAERLRLKVDCAACYTTSGYTPDGKKVARELDVELVDGNQLLDLLDRHFPGRYYNTL